MASDTAAGSIVVTTDQCVGFAEPAEILSRLTPDDLHLARLAGPHAWHPWGLTTAPPTDRHLRLVLPATACPGAGEQLLDRLESKLARTPWPPEGPLAIRRERAQLDCRDDDARRALIEVVVEGGGENRGYSDVVTRDGWPILDELAALNDRIHCISPDEPSRADLADLAGWVERKMVDPASGRGVSRSLAQLLADQARYQPGGADRLRSILASRGSPTVHQSRVHDYLAEQVEQARSARTAVGRRL